MAEVVATVEPSNGATESIKSNVNVRYDTYTDESQLSAIVKLMEKDLSEPYSIFTYRYFINNWPRLCWLVRNMS